MGGCQSCVTCQRCINCQSCNVSCNSSGCNTIQTFCETTGELVNCGIYENNSFSFGQSLTKDSLFLTKENWNKVFTFINNAYSKGTKPLTKYNGHGGDYTGITEDKDGTGGTLQLPSSDTNDFLTAEMFNKVSRALVYLNDSSLTNKINFKLSNNSEDKFEMQKDVDIVYGSYFQTLEDYINTKFKYKLTQCNDCNAGCNVQCNGCQLCDSGTCQSNAPIYCISGA